MAIKVMIPQGPHKAVADGAEEPEARWEGRTECCAGVCEWEGGSRAPLSRHALCWSSSVCMCFSSSGKEGEEEYEEEKDLPLWHMLPVQGNAS